VTVPLHAVRQAKRAAKRQKEPPAQELQPAAKPLVSQGARSSLPRPQPTPDDAIRRAAMELGSRPKWVRI
jgi:hypothetical protein